MRLLRRVVALAVLLGVLAAPVLASEQAPPEGGASDNRARGDQPAAGADAAPAQEPDDERTVNPIQPDFTLINLPTTVRVPRHASAFRVTHRFTRPLGQGTFGDLAGDLFGIDSGAQIGLEYRFGIAQGLQIGIHRTSDRTIQFFGQYAIPRQGRPAALGLAVMATIEGLDNFQEEHSPAVGLVISRTVGERMAVYAQPLWVGNTNLLSAETRRLLGEETEHTLLLGVGVRLRVSQTAYLVGEIVPRLAGFKGTRAVAGETGGVVAKSGATHATFAIEKRVGGHLFQLNVSNSVGTTISQLARGARNYNDWLLGFNISRKLY